MAWISVRFFFESGPWGISLGILFMVRIFYLFEKLSSFGPVRNIWISFEKYSGQNPTEKNLPRCGFFSGHSSNFFVQFYLRTFLKPVIFGFKRWKSGIFIDTEFLSRSKGFWKIFPSKDQRSFVIEPTAGPPLQVRNKLLITFETEMNCKGKVNPRLCL